MPEWDRSENEELRSTHYFYRASHITCTPCSPLIHIRTRWEARFSERSRPLVMNKKRAVHDTRTNDIYTERTVVLMALTLRATSDTRIVLDCSVHELWGLQGFSLYPPTASVERCKETHSLLGEFVGSTRSRFQTRSSVTTRSKSSPLPIREENIGGQ